MKAKESKRQRDERLRESNNGATLRTRVVEKKRKRNKRITQEELDEE